MISDKADSGNAGEADSKRISYELFILLVTLLSMVVMLVQFITRLPRQVDMIFLRADILFGPILLFDFFVRLRHAPAKMRYLFGMGIFDLLGSLPTVSLLRLLRLPRVVWQIRLIRRSTPRSLLQVARQQLAESTLLSVAFLVLLVVMFGSVAMVAVEEGAPNANIITGDDALWWSIVTIATVGYGDQYPVTTLGRLIGAVMIIMGVGLFSVVTSYIASAFFQRSEDSVDQQLAAIQAELAELRQMMAAQNQASPDRADRTPVDGS